MFMNYYTTCMSAGGNQLKNRFAKLCSKSCKIPKFTVLFLTVVLMVIAVCVTVAMAMFDSQEVSSGVLLVKTAETDVITEESQGTTESTTLMADAEKTEFEEPPVQDNTDTPTLVPTTEINIMWPCDSEVISRSYGVRANPVTGITTTHKGIDIAAAKGDAVYASISGTVQDAGFESEKGNYLVIANDEYSILYAHLESIDVNIGDKVVQGDTVAKVGNTGMSTGPHLHFEVMVDGKSVDAAARINIYD